MNNFALNNSQNYEVAQGSEMLLAQTNTGNGFWDTAVNAYQEAANAVSQTSTSSISTPAEPFPLSVDMGDIPGMDQLANLAFSVAQKYAPEGNSVFSWQNGMEGLENTNAQLAFVDSSLISDLDLDGAVPVNANAATFATADGRVTTLIFQDRVFFNPDGTERPGGVARLTAILAHELGGNMTEQLEAIQDGTIRNLDRVDSEINAFTVGVKTLENFIKSDDFSTLPENVQQGFYDALDFEKEGLASWQNAPR